MSIETDCTCVDMARRPTDRSETTSAFTSDQDMDFSKRMNSLSLQEDRVDSGLSSMGYISEELSYDNIQQSEKESANKSVSVQSLELEKSISNLNLDSSSDRCDSGINVEDCSSSKSLSEEKSREDSSNSNRSVPSSSSHFTIEQIDEIFRGDEDGDNHLHLSIIHGLKDVTLKIIRLAPDWDWLNQANNLLQTPLHIAVITRQPHIVRSLMCAGASVDVRDQLGNTPLHNACRLGFEDIVRVLLTPVSYEETFMNNYSIPFQRVPQDLDSRNYEGLTCLHLAAIGGHINVMHLLLRSGASVNASEGKNGRTVLHMAADWGNLGMLQFLLSMRETNIDAFTYAGLTPIYLAFGRHHREAVGLLLQFGASYEMQVSSDDSDMENSDDELLDDSASKAVSRPNIQQLYLQSCW